MPLRQWARTSARSSMALAASASLVACKPLVLDPAGPVARGDSTILIDSVVIMLAIVVPTIVATFGFAWWFRASNTRAVYRPHFVYSGQIEMIVWGIPLLVIMLLGGVAWVGAHELDPAAPLVTSAKPMEIQGVSLDWKWLFIYPQQNIALVNQLYMPVGVPVHFSLTSASVMNAFFVPQLGSMIYTMNGMTSRLNLMAERPGLYYGRSSHYSGDGFSGMQFDVHAVPAERFAAFVKSAQSAGPALDRNAYQALAVQSMNVAPATYRNVDPSLFQAITSQTLPPAQGPHPADAFSSKPRKEGP